MRPELPSELWRRIISSCDDCHSLLALSRVSRGLRSLALTCSLGTWPGIRRLSLLALPGRIEDAKNGRSISEDAVLSEVLPRSSHLVSLHLATDQKSKHGAWQPPSIKRSEKPRKVAARLLQALILRPPLSLTRAAVRDLREIRAVSGPPLGSVTVFEACVSAFVWVAPLSYHELKFLQSLTRRVGWLMENENSEPADVEGALANKTELQSLSFRGMAFLGVRRLLNAITGINSKRLKSLSLESVRYSGDFFSEASVSAVNPLSAITRLTLRKCSFIYAPALFKAMPNLEELSLSLVEASEAVKFALSFVGMYAGETDLPSHGLYICNDLVDSKPGPGRSIKLGNDAVFAAYKTALTHIEKQAQEKLDIALAQITHPQPETGRVQAGRLVLHKGRALVLLDTLYSNDLVHHLPGWYTHDWI